MALTSQQRAIVNRIIQIGKQRHATPKQIKAALETGRVESNFSNSSAQTDHDSEGWRQERASLYKNPTNLDASINRFYDETSKVASKYGRAGDLAAAVQRPAAQYRGRYQEQSAYVDQLLAGKLPAGGTVAKAASVATSTPDVQGRQRLLLAFLHRDDGTATAASPHTVGELQAQVKALPPIVTPGKPSPASGTKTTSSGSLPTGVGSFEGKKVAAWIVPALKYARAHGWKGDVTSGYRSFAEQQRIYNSGVRPAARPGTSNHEGTDFPRGAIDATDAAALSRILKASPYASKLIYAGTKDPVHFSHPHSGGY